MAKPSSSTVTKYKVTVPWRVWMDVIDEPNKFPVEFNYFTQEPEVQIEYFYDEQYEEYYWRYVAGWDGDKSDWKTLKPKEGEQEELFAEIREGAGDTEDD